ncbi:hypothetical protein X805_29860 [Sphaerotilus natans subsp. natans DSM 6575]|uniref:Uncharacterized protein n=1 Tax=Sphaerotilus natans subsp. natans DSM 6575 TaxID=1286631 RepID=A0A059KJM5_9BURK|nr:hypothetical protein X805_29860 [Sphaerotilus natans subsp. natans DSM 6575]
MRPGDRGHRRAPGLEARALREDRAAHRAARDPGVEHLGPVDHRAVGAAAREPEAALLRHPLLQPAALHAAGRADPDADHRSAVSRPARDLRHHHARQGRGARQGHAELHRQPRRHRRHALDHDRGRALRPALRPRRRPDRQEARPRQLGHLPHRGRGGSRHDGPRHPHDAGPARPGPRQRPLPPELRHARRAGHADRAGRAGPEGRRGLLQEGRPGHPAPGSRQGRLRRVGRQGRADHRPHPQESPGRAAQAAARVEQSAGAVPVGDPAQRLPLCGGAPGRDRRLGARGRSGDALGLRHAAGPVRAVAGRRLAAGRRLGEGGHRRRQDAVERAAARLGLRRPHRRAHARGLVVGGAGHVPASPGASGLPAPAFPRDRRRRERRAGAQERHRGLPQRGGARLDARRRGADRQHRLQAAPDQPDRHRRPAQSGGAGRGELSGPGDLVAGRRVLGRRQPRSPDAGLHEGRRQGHRARGEEAAGPDAAHPLRRRAGGGGDARAGAGRRL